MLSDNSASDFLDFEWNPTKHYLDRTTVAYGESGTGKSTVIIHLLKTLQPHVQQIVVFSPTDPQNKTYSCGIVPLPLIHYELSVEKLNIIWERQAAMAAVYAKANNADIITRVYRKCPNERVENFISRANRKREDTIKNICDQYMDDATVNKKCEEIERRFRELLTIVYKRAIYESRSELLKMQLSEDERFTVEYVTFNPRIVLIFDDCAAMLGDKKIRKSEVFKKMFYQNRWVYMTIIVAAHNDKNLEQDIRKNCYLTIFTSKNCATGFFTNKTNAIDADTVAKSREAIKCIDDPQRGFRRLAYVREESKFYVLTAKKFDPFPFCPGVINVYCDRIKSTSNLSIDKNNQFYGHFFAKKNQ